MKKTILFLIFIYQKIFSFDTGLPKKLGLVRRPVCIYYPTCSEYTRLSILKYGVFKGLKKGFKRFLRCTPKHEPGVDLP